MSWYRIAEIPRNRFLELIHPIYNILEEKKKSKSKEDPFTKAMFMSFYNQTEEEWKEHITIIQKQRAITMAWGIFHQQLMASFPGWEDYKTGHSSGCDIGRNDGTCVAEVKNNTNTMNADSKKSVMRKLLAQAQRAKRAILVIVNGRTPNKTYENGIEKISGKLFYEELSGRKTFMKDLEYTIAECFKRFKNFEQLENSLRRS